MCCDQGILHTSVSFVTGWFALLVDCVQAAEDVNRGLLKAADKLYELKALKEQEKIIEVCVALLSSCFLSSDSLVIKSRLGEGMKGGWLHLHTFYFMILEVQWWECIAFKMFLLSHKCISYFPLPLSLFLSLSVSLSISSLHFFLTMFKSLSFILSFLSVFFCSFWTHYYQV